MALTKLVKVDLVAADAFTGVFGVVNATNITDIIATGATCIWSGTGYTVTCTFDGTNTAEKLLNAQKFQGWLADQIQPILGPNSNQKKAYELFKGYTMAKLHEESGIVHTGGTANTALISIAVA